MEQNSEDAPLCACGCGRKVSKSKDGKKWLKNVKGHYFRSEEWLIEMRKRVKETTHFKIYNKTEEHSKIVSENNSKRVLSIETKNKISNSLKGHSRTEESKLRQSITIRDNKSKSEENHHLWKNERDPNWYEDVGEWHKLTKEIKKRDNYKCVQCGSPDKLQVHHKDFSKSNHSPLNLETLCLLCHRRKHARHRVSSVTKINVSA